MGDVSLKPGWRGKYSVGRDHFDVLYVRPNSLTPGILKAGGLCVVVRNSESLVYIVSVVSCRSELPILLGRRQHREEKVTHSGRSTAIVVVLSPTVCLQTFSESSRDRTLAVKLGSDTTKLTYSISILVSVAEPTGN